MHRIGLFIITVFASVGIIFYVTPYFQFASTYSLWSVITQPLKEKEINIAVLGIPGGKYDGSLLTDSIQIFHINFVNKKIRAISIPRDIWSTDMKDKINAAYYYGVTDYKDPLYWLTPELKKITGLSVSKYIVVDFQKFRKVVDALGTIDVVVDADFTDKKYPIAGRENDLCKGDKELKCRYQTVYFKKGLERMTGERALIFARSRQSKDIKNGTDFAREVRQQKIISAIIAKVLSPAFFMNRDKSLAFIKYMDTLFEKNVTLLEGAKIAYTIFVNKKNYSFKRVNLGDDLFTVPEYEKYDNKYVLIPKKSFEEIQKHIKKSL